MNWTCKHCENWTREACALWGKAAVLFPSADPDTCTSFSRDPGSDDDLIAPRNEG